MCVCVCVCISVGHVSDCDCRCFYLYLCGSSVFHIVILCVFLPVFPWVMFNIVTAFVRVLTRVSVGPLTEPPTT